MKKGITVYIDEIDLQKLKQLSCITKTSMSSLLNPIVYKFINSDKFNTLFKLKERETQDEV